jgi:hypothetical protein
VTRAEALARLDALVLEATRGCGVHCTPAITKAVVAWCEWMGAGRVVLEQEQPYRRAHGDGSQRFVAHGRVDVAAGWATGERLAIEIDSRHKSASAEKLRLKKADGCKILWLRWDRHNRVEGEPPDGIATHWVKIAEPKKGRVVPGWVKARLKPRPQTRRDVIALLEAKP